MSTYSTYTPANLKNTGVYFILNLTNAKMYVGSTTRSFGHRWGQHLRDLEKKKHPNRHLQHAWNTYGRHRFYFGIIEQCAPEKCLEREQWWLDFYRPYDLGCGYNLSPTAMNTLGMKHGKEARENMSKAHMGKKPSVETRRKKAVIMRAVWANPNYKMRLSAKRKGRKHTPETIAKITAANIGRKMSAEAIAKMSAAKKGKKVDNKSDAARKKLSAALKGNRNAAGRTLSAETIRKMSAARAAYWARKKQLSPLSPVTQ